MTPRHLAIPQTVILTTFLLFITIIALSTLDLQYTGRATTSATVFVTNVTPANCTFTASPGYNIISLPCVSTAAPIGIIVNSSPILAMYQYVPDEADRWRVYNPNLPPWVVSDLQYLTRREGYVLIMNGSVNSTIEGFHPAQTDVPLLPGWNLVGYPAFDQRNVSSAFGATLSSITNISTYNKSTEGWISYPSGGLTVITPGVGYWVNSTAGTSWTVIP